MQFSLVLVICLTKQHWYIIMQHYFFQMKWSWRTSRQEMRQWTSKCKLEKQFTSKVCMCIMGCYLL